MRDEDIEDLEPTQMTRAELAWVRELKEQLLRTEIWGWQNLGLGVLLGMALLWLLQSVWSVLSLLL